MTRGPLLSSLIRTHQVRIFNGAYLYKERPDSPANTEVPIGMVGEEVIIESYIARTDLGLEARPNIPEVRLLRRLRKLRRRFEAGEISRVDMVKEVDSIMDEFVKVAEEAKKADAPDVVDAH